MYNVVLVAATVSNNSILSSPPPLQKNRAQVNKNKRFHQQLRQNQYTETKMHGKLHGKQRIFAGRPQQRKEKQKQKRAFVSTVRGHV